MTDKQALSPEYIEAQRRRLEALKAELLGGQGAALQEIMDLQEDTGREAQEYEEGAQALDQRNVLQARRDVDAGRLANIARALEKIELGSYGLSDMSGEPIPKARLDATPEAVLTVEEAASKE